MSKCLAYTKMAQTEFTNSFCYGNVLCKLQFTQIAQSKAAERKVSSFSLKP